MKKRGMGKNLWRKAAAGILSAAMVLTSVPGELALAASVETQDVIQNEKELRLWYTSSAPDSYDGWEKWALPLGNSSIGASVFGKVDRERIQLNEKSFWSGGPSDKRADYNGGNILENGQNGAQLKKIQQLFREGKNAEAASECNKLTGLGDDSGTNGYGYYLSYGNMYLEFNGMTESNAQNYVRDLDMETAVAGVSYDYNGVHYNRENFVSYPDNVLVTKLTSDQTGSMNFKVDVVPDQAGNASGERTFTKTAKDGRITIAGQLTDNQLKFNSSTKVVNKDGTLQENADGTIQVSGASEVVIYTSIGTDYKNDYPVYRTGDSAGQLQAKVENYVNKAVQKGYDKVKSDHIKDYTEIFGRVDLELGQIPSQQPTNQLLSSYNDGTASQEERRNLEVMLFQYGRYLTMGSSREARPGEDVTLPSNLQGIWVGKNNSAWHSDYHMNVNLQMNYWPTYVTNMAECADPLVSYVDSLREPGRVTAAVYAGIESTEENPENGFMAHTQNNPFGWTCPGWVFDWGWSPAAVPWILQNCWEQYEYTGDLEYMKKNIYPMLKEEAVLYNQMLIKDEDGKYISSPAYSPEQGPKTNGNTYEQTLIWQLLTDAITAGKLCGEDPAVLAQWQDKLDNLKGPVEIGDSGQIKEWYEETTFNKDANGNNMGEGEGHRHMSNLLGLFPGDLISSDTTELMEAAQYSLTHRMDKTTGWGMGQRINTWARTGNGEHAYKVITDLFSGGILTNLWDTHSPYQIDGNFGMTSGVAEMLIQSNMGYINILPALPSAWAQGSVKGLVARGNFEVGIEWEKESPTNITVLSKNGGEAQVQSSQISTATVTDASGLPVNYTAVSADRISFNTEKGQTYYITNLPVKENVCRQPESVKAISAGGNKVNVSWAAVAGENVSYQVYRQTASGETRLVADKLMDSKYTDTTAYSQLGQTKYRVKAILETESGKKQSAYSIWAITEAGNGDAGMIDDRDAGIVYSGKWGTYGEAGLYKNTSHFVESPVGNETAAMKFTGTGIVVYATVNKDRGIAEVWVDGVKLGDADSYSATKANYAEIFRYNQLENKEHELVLKVANRRGSGSTTKFELDAFCVLDPESVVNSVEVGSKSGMTIVAKESSTLPLYAKVDTLSKNKEVTWKVTDKNGNATELAQISEQGILQTGNVNGVVRATATSVQDSSVSGHVDITIAMADPAGTDYDTEKLEFAVSNVANSNFTWTGTWAPYNKDNVGANGKNHDNLDKIDGSKQGSTVTGSFTGTGIGIFGQKHPNFGKFSISIDGGTAEEVNTQFSQDYKDVELYKKMNLAAGTHTFVITTLEAKTIALDYLFAYTPAEGTEVVDKSGLQDVLEIGAGKYEERFTPETWSVFKTAFDAAVIVMNDLEAKADAVSEAVTELNGAVEQLSDRAVLPKPDVTGKEITLVDTGKTSAIVAWDEVETADHYEVYAEGNDTEAIKTAGTVCELTGLLPGKEYNIKVKVVSRIGETAEFPPLTVTTLEEVDSEAPSQVANLKQNGLTVTWDAASDNVAVARYEIWINGTKYRVNEPENLSCDISGLEEGKVYTISVRALDAAGNTSVPSVLSFVKGKTILRVASVEACKDLNAAWGTGFDKLALPKTVKVLFQNGGKAEVGVTWNPAGYSAEKSGKQTITGELAVVEGMENPDNLKATITVVVAEKPAPPTPSKPLQKITLNKTSLSLKSGTVSRLTVAYVPADTTDSKSVIWSSSNSVVASVAKDGTVKAGKAGQAVVTATCGKMKASCTVKVSMGATGKLSQSAWNTSSISLKWDKTLGADGYRLYQVKGKKSTLLTTVKAGSKLSYRVKKLGGKSLKEGTSYSFKVVPYATVGKDKVTGASQSLKATTATKAPKISAKKASSKSSSITWKKVKEANGYEVYMSQKKTKGYAKVVTLKKSGTLKYKKTGLKKGKTYYFKTRTYRMAGKTKVYSAYSNVGKVKL